MQRLVAVWVLSLCYCCMAGAAPENMITDPGLLENSITNHSPGKNWWIYDAKGPLKVDRDISAKLGDKASVRFLGADGDTKSVLVSPPILVAPGDKLHFEVHVRAENLPAAKETTYAGFAFRNAEGKIFQRAYFKSDSLITNWSLIAGDATAPAAAVKAEVHLGYTNSPGTVWFSSPVAVITNPISLSLVEGAKPWVGDQEIVIRVANRQSTPFRGKMSSVIARKSNSLPVVVAPNTSREFKLPIHLNGIGAHNYEISLLDGSGKSVRDLEGKFHTASPLVLFPACPCYQLVGENNGKTRIDARVNMNPAQFAGLILRVDLLNADGTSIQNANVAVTQNGLAGLELQVPLDVPGVFQVAAHLVDRTGKEVASASTDVNVDPPGLSRVSLQPDGFLEVAGKPNFPIGLYSCSRFQELGKAGFTATHDYQISSGAADDPINSTDPELKDLLDKTWANGMRMMVELPRKAIEQAKWQQVRRRIETFRHHPGLLCWGSEERVARGDAPAENIAALYKLVHELDPDHPLVLGDSRDVIQKFVNDRRDFFPDSSMDIGIWWWYPIPLKGGDANGLDGTEKDGSQMEPPSWLTTTHSKKPLWIAIQSYQKPARDARFPTPEEYRCQAYLSIINGVKGLFFYTGSGQRDYQGKPAGLLNKPEAAHWDYVKQLIHELREMSPVIMASCPGGKLEISPANSSVEFTERELDGKLYLLAANKSARPQKVQFTGEVLKNRKAQVMYESHSAEISGVSLADEFAPFGVHVYQLAQ